MFRKMRRIKQQLPAEECEQILENASSGVLSVIGDDGYPYGVPLSFVYKNNAIYFHCAKEGHKLDSIRKCPKVSFCVINKDEILPEKYTTLFRSVIVFGKAAVLEDKNEIYNAIYALAAKYNPEGREEDHNAEIEKTINHLCMVKTEIEHMTGKEGIELTRMRNS